MPSTTLWRKALAALLLAACSSSGTGNLPGGDGGTSSGADAGAPVANPDYLRSYRPGSLFVFAKHDENGRTGTKTDTHMLWSVVSVDDQGAVLMRSSTASPGEENGKSTVWLRKTGAVLEASSPTWTKCFDPASPGTGGTAFVVAHVFDKPSKMCGSMKDYGGRQDVSTPAGSFLGAVYVKREYMPDSSCDPFLYDNGGVESWDAEVGLVQSDDWYQDWEMGYPYNISLSTKRTLAWAEIHQADGTKKTLGTMVGFDQPPEAPRQLSALREGYPKLFWKDYSVFEESFVFERREGDTGAWAEVGTTEAEDDIWYDQTAEAAKNYTYRVKARNRSGDSAPSNEASVSAEGSPSAPHYAGWYWEVANTKLSVRSSAMATPVITEFALGWWDGAAWKEVSPRIPASEATPKFSGAILEIFKQLYWNGSEATLSPTGSVAWPGTPRIAVKTVNTLGSSAWYEASEVK